MVNKKKSKEKRIKKVPEYRSLTERKEEVKKIAIQKKGRGYSENKHRNDL